MIEWENKLNNMKEKKVEEEINSRREIQKKIKMRSEKVNNLLNQNKSEKENKKQSKLKELANKEDEIKKQLEQHFSEQEEMRLNLELMIHQKSKMIIIRYELYQ